MEPAEPPAQPAVASEPEAATQPTEAQAPPLQQALENQISLLTELNERVDGLRQTGAFLRPGVPPPPPAGLAPGSILSGTTPTSLRQGFEQLKQLADKVQSDSVQEALKAAKEREAKDRSSIGFGHRNRRQPKRPLSPDSPQPYRSFQPRSSSLFPPDDPATPALRADGLVDYIKEYNKTNAFRLHIWTATSHGRPAEHHKLPDPLIVRFIIRDVVTVYLTLDTAPPDSTIVVESATAFGSREKKPPHSQSDYIVYQRLSQHLAKMLQSKPQASFQLVMQLLGSYEDLFVRQCTACHRVTSAEGHVPPVVRTWVDAASDAATSGWDARHAACAQT